MKMNQSTAVFERRNSSAARQSSRPTLNKLEKQTEKLEKQANDLAKRREQAAKKQEDANKKQAQEEEKASNKMNVICASRYCGGYVAGTVVVAYKKMSEAAKELATRRL